MGRVLGGEPELVVLWVEMVLALWVVVRWVGQGQLVEQVVQLRSVGGGGCLFVAIFVGNGFGSTLNGGFGNITTTHHQASCYDGQKCFFHCQIPMLVL